MNRDVVKGYSDLVKYFAGELGIEDNPEKLFNVDETGLQKNKCFEISLPNGEEHAENL
jgi:hypothetical protein